MRGDEDGATLGMTGPVIFLYPMIRVVGDVDMLARAMSVSCCTLHTRDIGP